VDVYPGGKYQGIERHRKGLEGRITTLERARGIGSSMNPESASSPSSSALLSAQNPRKDRGAIAAQVSFDNPPTMSRDHSWPSLSY
jgi:hypothetical protein